MLSTVFSDRRLRDTFLADLSAWMETQRWYSAKGTGTPTLKVAGWVRLVSTPRRTTTFATFEADDGRRFAIPLTWTYLADVALDDSAAMIATIDTPNGIVYVSDATAVAEARAMLVEGLCREKVEGEGITLETRLDEPDALSCSDRLNTLVSTERHSGEQSNTSLIATCPDGSRIIIKIFRHLHEGDNPDIAIQRALHDAGNTRIAPFLGSVHMVDAVGPSDVALIQMFLPEVQDAWKQALMAASSGESFRDRAAALGLALAHVHADLASMLPTSPASVNAVRLTIEAMKTRFAEFSAEVPELAEFSDAINEAYSNAARLTWRAFQRIHGDLHLGQVLNSPDRGWILLDFEGEPMRPMDERTRPDSPARDVAGILRSFDYTAAYVELNEGNNVQDWAREAREAFLEAYLSEYRALHDDSSNLAAATDADLRALIAVFELDKAAYEAVYEARNRPEWAEIPQRALAHLTGKE